MPDPFAMFRLSDAQRIKSAVLKVEKPTNSNVGPRNEIIARGGGGSSVQLVVLITSALTRPAHYRGILGVRKSDVIDVDDTPVLAPSDYYDAGIEVTIVNWDEEGSDTHELMEDDRNRTLFPCWATGNFDSYDFPIYAIDGSNVQRGCNLVS